MPKQPAGKKLLPGGFMDGIPVADWNDFLDAAAYVKALKSNVERGRPVKTTRRTGTVKFRNEAGSNLRQFNVIGIDSGESMLWKINQFPAEFKRECSVEGKVPLCTDHVGRFGIVIEPANTHKPGNIGLAVVDGFVQCKVLVCDTSHEYADIKDGDVDKLVSVGTLGGAQIISIEPGLGTKWAIVRIGNKPSGTACVSTCTTTSQTTQTTTTPTTTTPTTTTATTQTTTTGTTPTTTTGTTGTGTTATTTSGTTTGTTGTGTTATTTPTTGTGTTTSTTTGTTGTGTTTTGTTGTTSTSTTTGTTPTTTVSCPSFDCSGDCQITLEVVTDIRCDEADGLVVIKTAICLESWRVGTGTTEGA